MLNRITRFLDGARDAANRSFELSRDARTRYEIHLIDEQIRELQKDRDYYLAKLHHALPDEKISDDYDPFHFPKPKDEGRLVDCPGRDVGEGSWSKHPECTHDEPHMAHDFMLRD